ncbi:MAG: cytochrome o ubiquinol oxidase subunit IV [Candidatus Tokpelaia sp.]|uniref:cytochrome o ubiquinol oxidase subunit IV n=1 Tax=Candidatus Tokpelaia sp. TaxID=2233777 RepID=UPI00123A54B7|nr:cytochrome o ubiquinol oxidase subunit IV [Candidatus Tokpelaia sp.]KAA6204936.1 MAG: cytochrome o ubiquinol oxidase subunit IV [Candidatus Tokpelaia sp.]KAA6207083.1 MAG: cytochrome o ubiquinol oxidase subunit IV [Candidatus Tokpelaia sp.]KAA6405376.1 cytochrome o ubiquinol oxidase subunit IV [Candidatus Tokpelaia sp.]
MVEQTHTAHGSAIAKYVIGFVLSVLLTLAAFLPVMNNWLADWSVSAKVLYLLGLALVQMMVQITFFLHLTDGPDARYNIITMWAAIVCVFIIIAGTWWVMWHLNYQVMGGAGRIEQSDVIYPANAAPAATQAQ